MVNVPAFTGGDRRVDRTGLDRTGLDRTGPDPTGLDLTTLDRTVGVRELALLTLGFAMVDAMVDAMVEATWEPPFTEAGGVVRVWISAAVRGCPAVLCTETVTAESEEVEQPLVSTPTVAAAANRTDNRCRRVPLLGPDLPESTGQLAAGEMDATSATSSATSSNAAGSATFGRPTMA